MEDMIGHLFDAVAAALPVITVLYGVGDFSGFWDLVRGRKSALRGWDRLRSGKGYPVGWIYDDEPDFDSLERVIRRHTRNERIQQLQEQGRRPSLITVAAGQMLSVRVPHDFPDTTFVPGTTPILFVYGVSRNAGKGKATWVGSLEDTQRWIEDDRNTERFWALTLIVGVLSIIVALPGIFP